MSRAMWRRAGILAALLLTAVVAYAAATSIRGVVQLNGAPQKGIQVMLKGAVNKTATTNAKGFFKFDGIPAGNYKLVIKQRGFRTLTKKVAVKDGQTLRVLLQLKADARPADKKPKPSPVAAEAAPEPRAAPMEDRSMALGTAGRAAGSGAMGAPSRPRKSRGKRVSGLTRRAPPSGTRQAAHRKARW